MWRGRKLRNRGRSEGKPRPAGPVEVKVGVHDWVFSRELHCLVCQWCGEAESMAVSGGCPAVLIRDREGQVFQTRLLEEEQIPSIVDGVGILDTESESA